MKAKDIIAKIAESLEYYKLVKLWSSEDNNTKDLPPEIVQIVKGLNKRIYEEKQSFFRSFGLKSREPHANTITFKVPQDIQTAKNEFDKELKEQMLVFVELMDLIPAGILFPALKEDLVPEPIAI